MYDEVLLDPVLVLAYSVKSLVCDELLLDPIVESVKDWANEFVILDPIKELATSTIDVNDWEYDELLLDSTAILVYPTLVETWVYDDVLLDSSARLVYPAVVEV